MKVVVENNYKQNSRETPRGQNLRSSILFHSRLVMRRSAIGPIRSACPQRTPNGGRDRVSPRRLVARTTPFGGYEPVVFKQTNQPCTPHTPTPTVTPSETLLLRLIPLSPSPVFDKTLSGPLQGSPNKCFWFRNSYGFILNSLLTLRRRIECFSFVFVFVFLNKCCDF